MPKQNEPFQNDPLENIPREKDPLWDPTLASDAQLQHLEVLLQGYRAKALPAQHQWRSNGAAIAAAPRQSSKRRRRRWFQAMLAVAAASAVFIFAHHYRLSWPSDQVWTGVTYDANTDHAKHANSNTDRAQLRTLQPGQSIQTSSDQLLTLQVARIGSIELAPNSMLTLEATSSEAHRVRLESGHMRAKIWAPPGLFAVSTGAAEVVDLGCEFELWRSPDGAGRVLVQSGWVAFRTAATEVLLPAHYTLRFDAQQADTPLHQHASAAFSASVKLLDQRILEQGENSPDVVAAAAAAARAALPSDQFTLLHLMTKHPALARTAIYPRLAQELGIARIDTRHQKAWINGELAAMNAWWDRLPTQPKQWWQNWRDAL